jgi:GxxExxY protein
MALDEAPGSEDEEITTLTVEACVEVHRRLGPGLTERVYARALCQELCFRGLTHQAHVALPVYYRGVRLDAEYEVDVCVAGRLVVEVVAVAELLPVYRAELRTKLRLTGLSRGLLVNFRVSRLATGIVLLKRTADDATTGRRVALPEPATRPALSPV